MKLRKEYPDDKICVLNFASAMQPGGGVKRGSGAQEESLCRCSTLFATLDRKWFWYMEGNVLYAHRSWTGFCIFMIAIFPEGEYHEVIVNRDPEQYQSTSLEQLFVCTGNRMCRSWKIYAIRKRNEVDFAVHRADRRYYIQSALRMDTREKMLQEEKSLLRTGDFFRKIIIVGGTQARIENCRIWYLRQRVSSFRRLVAGVMYLMTLPEAGAMNGTTFMADDGCTLL